MASETMTVQEVADYLRVSRQTIYIMVRAGKLPHFRVGSKVRFKRSEIEALTATTTQPVQAQLEGFDD